MGSPFRFLAVATGVLAVVLLRSKSSRRLVNSKQNSTNANENKPKRSSAKVYLVGAGPGAADLITVRAVDLLKRADVVMNDRLVSPEIISKYCKASCEVLNVGKSSEKERFSQKDLEVELIEAAKRVGPDSIVVRLKGGDPYVFGLGASEGESLDKAGIEWEYVPGLSSATTLPGMCLRAPLTHKNVSSGFIVLSGHVSPNEGSGWYQLPKGEPMLTLVVIMCAKNLHAITQFLQQTLGWSSSIPAGVIQSGSTVQERVLVSTLGRIAEDAVANKIDEAPLSLVVGKSVGVFPPQSSSLSTALPTTDSAANVWGEFREVTKTSKNNQTGEETTWKAVVGTEKRHADGSNEDEWWVFGYGSLIWRPSEDVPHVHAEDGYIEGFARRFWQQSPDHRGTEEFPGRVATIVPSEELSRLVGQVESVKSEKVFGRVFKVDPRKISETREKLLFREKAGYEERTVEVMLKNGKQIKASVFVALPTNEHFVGPEHPQAIAERIHHSVGPSGRNTEYFQELVTALHAMRDRWGSDAQTVDPHLVEINEQLKAIQTRESSSDCAGDDDSV